MESIDKIKQDELEMISNLSMDGLKVLFDNLTKKYYNAFINNDIGKCNSTIAFINDVYYMFEDDVDDIGEYINFSMLKNANFIIQTLYKRNHTLEPFLDVDMESWDAINNLQSSIRRSLIMKINKVDKVNIKNLHDMCVVGETIDENMVETVNALYDSFNSKKDDKKHDKLKGTRFYGDDNE